MKALLLAAAVVVATASLAAQQIPANDLIVGVGNFIHTVSDLDRSLAFYRDTLGMEMQAPANGAPAPAGPRPLIATPEILNLYDAAGGQYRVGATLVQGSPMRAELIEFANIDKRVARRTLQDPGAARLVLTVRDLEAAFTQAKFRNVTVLSEGGMPIAFKDERGSARGVLLQDPDGFFVQLIQRDTPPPATAPPGNIIDVAFGVTVDDMDRTLKIFQDTLGFQTTVDPEDNDVPRLAMLGIFTAYYRRVTAIVPGTSFEVEFLEVHGLDRRQIRPRPRDPGTAILRLRVADIDRTIAALQPLKVNVVSAGGVPVTVTGAANTQRFAMTETPDHFLVQLVQAVAR